MMEDQKLTRIKKEKLTEKTNLETVTNENDKKIPKQKDIYLQKKEKIY